MRDVVDLLSDLIADHYGGDSVETMRPPIATLLAAQDELVKLRLKVIEQGSRLDTLTGERDGWKEISDDAMAELKAARSRLGSVTDQNRFLRNWIRQLRDTQEERGEA